MTDIEMRDLLEKNISNHEVVLTDLESRQVNMKYFWNLSDYIKTLQGLRSVVSARWRKDCYEVRLNISKYFQNFLRDRNRIFTATTPGLEQYQLTPVKNIFLMQLFLTVYWNNALHRFCISYEMKTTMFGIWSKGMVLYFHFFLFVSENI